MAEADGFVRISTEFDDSNITRKLQGLGSKLNRELQALERAKSNAEALRRSLEQISSGEIKPKSVTGLEREIERAEKDAEKYSKQMDALKEERSGLAANNATGVNDDAIKDVNERLEEVGAKFAEASNRADELKAKLQELQIDPSKTEEAQAISEKLRLAEGEMERLSIDAEQTRSQMEELQNSTGGVEEEVERSANAFERFGLYIKRLAKRMLVLYAFRRVFTFIRNSIMSMTGISIVTGELQNFIGKMKQMYASNEQVKAALANLRGSLYTAFQPIYNAVVPALVTLINWLATVISYIGTFFAALSGQSWGDSSKGAEDFAKSMGKVGSAAKGANNQLAKFDKLNTLSESGGGGGGGGASPVSFDVDKTKLQAFFEWVQEHMEAIKRIAKDVGLAFAGWTIGNLLGQIPGLGPMLQTLAGIAMIIYGAFEFVDGYIDAWVNGLTFDNLTQQIGGVAIAVTGLALVFGATGAAIGLLVAGVAFIVEALHSLAQNGKLTTEAFTALEIGLMAVAVALGLLGAPILAIVAGFAAAAVAIHHFWDNIASWLDSLADKLEEAGYDALAGFVKAFVEWGNNAHQWVDEHIVTPFVTWLKNLFGIHSPSTVMAGIGENLVNGLLGGLKDTWDSLLTWLSGVWDSLSSWWENLELQPFHIPTPHFEWGTRPAEGVVATVLSALGLPAEIPTLTLRWYAAGGFPNMGEMFIAGEAGPELVGSFGGHNNSVINEAQLVEAFRQASSEQVSLLQQQNALLTAILNKSGEVTFKPSSSAGRVFQQSINMYNRATG